MLSDTDGLTRLTRGERMAAENFDEGRLDALLAHAISADEEGRRALVLSGSLATVLGCAESAAQLCRWERAEKAARCACAMSASTEPKRQLTLDGYGFCYNHDEALSWMPKSELLNALLYLAR